jgi:hypothetical protein
LGRLLVLAEALRRRVAASRFRRQGDREGQRHVACLPVWARLWRVPNQPYGADTPLLPGGAWGSCGDSSRRLPWSPARFRSRRKSATLSRTRPLPCRFSRVWRPTGLALVAETFQSRRHPRSPAGSGLRARPARINSSLPFVWVRCVGKLRRFIPQIALVPSDIPLSPEIGCA